MHRSFARPRRARHIVVAALVSLVSAFAGPIGPALGQDVSGGEPVRTLEEAIGGHRISQQLVAELRREGAVEATVVFDNAEALSHAAAVAKPGKDRIPSMIEDLRRSYEGSKAAAFRAAGSDVEVIDRLEFLPMALVRIGSEEALLDLLRASKVAGIADNGTGTTSTRESIPLVRANLAASAGYTGKGVFVAVLDTGVDYGKADFGYCTAPGGSCRIAGTYETAPDDGLRDSSGHGTNVAGIVANVAPGASILSLDVFRYPKNYEEVDVQKGVNQVIAWRQQGYNIRAINLSLGYANQFNSSNCTYAPSGSVNPYTNLFAQLNQLNVLPVVASGNDAMKNGFRVGVSFPACTAGAVRVGAVWDANLGAYSTPHGCSEAWTERDKVTCFSQTGQTLTLLAPGAPITAGGQVGYQGTSQAAPHVAGAVAVLASASPSATSSQILSAMTSTGRSVTDTRAGYAITRPRLDVKAALDRILGTGTVTDSTKPTIALTTPMHLTHLGTMGATDAPVTLTWSASDGGGSGLSTFEVWRSIDGGAYGKVATVTATTYVASVAPGHAYAYLVRAFDRAGNYADSNTASFSLHAYQEDGAGVSYSGSWTRRYWASAYGAYESSSITQGDQVTFTFTGREVAWIAPRSSIGGQAYVYLDGVYDGTVDLYRATTTAKQVVYAGWWADRGDHRLTIRVVGTAGHPQVDVDGFVVLR